MTEDVSAQNTIHLPKGFSFSALASGIKASGRPDLALIEAAEGTCAAALFTKNRLVAAPVEVGRKSLAASRGRVRAVLVNAGNANCATGLAGIKACCQVCQETAKILGVAVLQVVPSSTGIIGVPLPSEKIVANLPALFASRQATEQKFLEFSDAILTTDTRRKIASAKFRVGKNEVSILGVAKGSGMIHPQLATMLVYIMTDIAAKASELKSMLRDTCDESFNCISVDGDTSTNDTVLLLASGQSCTGLKDSSVKKKFRAALNEVAKSLADQVILDGEGMQHVIRLHIEEAKSREEALQIARAIAHSLLVKTAFAGADPNWGRILAAIGRSGISVDPSKVNILISDQIVCRNGTSSPFDAAKAHADLARPECKITVRLRRGRRSIVFTTTDLTAEYVRINADYST
ncbi:MAG TPA: bifunctional glutamate N-acetyltransferase/amino-acid acetyltransferase ArgJ [Terriglobales bacterium]|nr:bifunctional glutamate N-acetyltransferase/amino-acid acetyltransferase ArgJ [Terriglobales bacterium]